MAKHARNFLQGRVNQMDTDDKLQFFNMLLNVAVGPDDRFDMIELSQQMQNKLILLSWQLEPNVKMMLSDLILIGISKNQQHVKSVAANYRKIIPRYASTVRQPSTAAHTNNDATQDIEICQMETIVSSDTNHDDTIDTEALSLIPTVDELCRSPHMFVTRSISVKDFLQKNDLRVIFASSDGHCILHSWTIITGSTLSSIHQSIIDEYLLNREIYAAFLINEDDLHRFLACNEFRLQSIDSVVNMLCNSNNTTAIIVEETQPGQTHFKILRPRSNQSTTTIFLLRKAEHYDAIVSCHSTV